jgi:hypothetical protein
MKRETRLGKSQQKQRVSLVGAEYERETETRRETRNA